MHARFQIARPSDLLWPVGVWAVVGLGWWVASWIARRHRGGPDRAVHTAAPASSSQAEPAAQPDQPDIRLRR